MAQLAQKGAKKIIKTTENLILAVSERELSEDDGLHDNTVYQAPVFLEFNRPIVEIVTLRLHRPALQTHSA